MLIKLAGGFGADVGQGWEVPTGAGTAAKSDKHEVSFVVVVRLRVLEVNEVGARIWRRGRAGVVPGRDFHDSAYGVDPLGRDRAEPAQAQALTLAMQPGVGYGNAGVLMPLQVNADNLPIGKCKDKPYG